MLEYQPSLGDLQTRPAGFPEQEWEVKASSSFLVVDQPEETI